MGASEVEAEAEANAPRRRPPEREEPELPEREPDTEAEGAKPPKQRSETFMRVIWALPAIALAITVIVLGGEVFAATMLVFAIFGMGEFFRMTARAQPFELIAYLAAAAVIAAALYGDSFHMVLAGLAFFPVMLLEAARRPTLRNVTFSLATTVFAVVWIAFPFAHAVLIRELPEHGAAILLNIAIATFLSDTFAYLGGRAIGRHPLAPTISPNKTVEGLAVGMLGGTLGFWCAGLYQDWLSGVDALLMGAAIAIIAPTGDLFESAIKRDLGVKDSGRVFGPHGGVLDRLDAILFTVVAGYYLSLLIIF